MFAIPGILALVFFIYLRPQEFVPALAGLPLLYGFFALALFGLAVDLKRRINRAEPAPQVPWVALYFVWALITVAITAPAQLGSIGLQLMISILLFVLVAQGLHTFRAIGLLAGLLFGLALFLGALGVHQGTAEFGCAVVDMSNPGDLSVGEPDGRPCQQEFECYRGDPEPGADYICERIGLLGTTSVASGRVRYRGVLQDPNELGVTISMGLMIGLGFWWHRRRARWLLLSLVGGAAVLVALYFTRSRTAQLAFMAGLGVYVVYRYRWRAVLAGAALGLPVIAVIMSGEGRTDAEASTLERLEAARVAITLFRSSPIWGVGADQFTEHHFLTAHNSWLLAAAETGLIGMVLWATTIYTSFKIPLAALRRYRDVPAARIAVSWSLAVLAALVPMALGATFTSWTHHLVLWIHVGLSGALYSAIRTHDAEFKVRVGVFEVAAVAVGCVGLIAAYDLYLRLKGL